MTQSEQKVYSSSCTDYSSTSSVVIPYGYTEIGEDAFYGCANLTKVSISDSLVKAMSITMSAKKKKKKRLYPSYLRWRWPIFPQDALIIVR